MYSSEKLLGEGGWLVRKGREGLALTSETV